MSNRPLNDAELKALANVIDYNWQDEYRDYEEQDEEGKADHVFRDLNLLDDFLNEIKA